jgi:hypothetical protein
MMPISVTEFMLGGGTCTCTMYACPLAGSRQ